MVLTLSPMAARRLSSFTQMIPRVRTRQETELIIYAIKHLLEHITAGMQYVLGDLQADDRPSAAVGK